MRGDNTTDFTVVKRNILNTLYSMFGKSDKTGKFLEDANY